MFKNLKEKLRGLKKKASEEVDSTEQVPETGKVPKESKAVEPRAPSKAKLSRKERVRQKKRELKGLRGSDFVQVEKRDVSEGSGEGLFSKKISDKKMEEILWDLEMGLLESDVAMPVIEEIKDHLQKELGDAKLNWGADPGAFIEKALRNAIINVLITEQVDFDEFVKNHDRPLVLMFVGVNGTGKTTAIARIAYRLKKMGISSVMAACDTFRAGAIEQLERHSKRIGVRIIKQSAGSDPAAIAFDAVEHAKARHKDVVLIDTAGRMHSNANLMDEMKKIKRVSKPHMIIFVGDSLAGNDTTEQAVKFNETVGIDAAILTKIDADAKGGAALSIAHSVGKPIIFVGIGQKYLDLIPFNAEWMVNRLFE